MPLSSVTLLRRYDSLNHILKRVERTARWYDGRPMWQARHVAYRRARRVVMSRLIRGTFAQR